MTNIAAQSALRGIGAASWPASGGVARRAGSELPDDHTPRLLTAPFGYSAIPNSPTAVYLQREPVVGTLLDTYA